MNIPYVKIVINKTDFQFYYEEKPIHPDRLFPKLKAENPTMINVVVYKNEKIFWDAYYLIKNEGDIEKYIWKAFKLKV